jgi:hypothetical protein
MAGFHTMILSFTVDMPPEINEGFSKSETNSLVGLEKSQGKCGRRLFML